MAHPREWSRKQGFWNTCHQTSTMQTSTITCNSAAARSQKFQGKHQVQVDRWFTLMFELVEFLTMGTRVYRSNVTCPCHHNEIIAVAFVKLTMHLLLITFCTCTRHFKIHVPHNILLFAGFNQHPFILVLSCHLFVITWYSLNIARSNEAVE